MKLLVLFALIGIAVAQFPNYSPYRPVSTTTQKYQTFAPYRPVSTVTKKPRGDNSGKYNPGGDGKYRPANDGKYSGGNDGRYNPGGDGKYRDDGAGKYNGTFDPYAHKGSGQNPYQHQQGDLNPYKHQPDKIDPYKHKEGAQGPGSKYQPQPVTSSTRAPVKYQAPVTAAPRPIVPLITLKPATGPPFGYQAPPTGTPYTRTFNYGHGEGGWKIIRDIKEINRQKENYAYEYETENKILGAEKAYINNPGTDTEGLKASGFYEYIGDDGVKYHVDYTADENGFIPVAPFIPTPPPIPELIQRALDYVAAKNAAKKLKQ